MDTAEREMFVFQLSRNIVQKAEDLGLKLDYQGKYIQLRGFSDPEEQPVFYEVSELLGFLCGYEWGLSDAKKTKRIEK